LAQRKRKPAEKAPAVTNAGWTAYAPALDAAALLTPANAAGAGYVAAVLARTLLPAGPPAEMR
jgi:hypothetical protein